jgi:hypothetical protein
VGGINEGEGGMGHTPILDEVEGYTDEDEERHDGGCDPGVQLGGHLQAGGVCIHIRVLKGGAYD